MPFELKDGQGSLFRNEKKTSEKQPDYRGDLMIDGVKYSLSAWIKTGKNGKFFSIACQVPQQRSEYAKEKPKNQETGAGVFDDLEDDIPF